MSRLLVLALCVLAAPAYAQVSFSPGPAMWAPVSGVCAQHWSATQISASLTGGGTNAVTNTATNIEENAFGGQNATTGKLYVEFAFTGANFTGDGTDAIGIGNTSSTFASGQYLGEGFDTVGLYLAGADLHLYINNADTVDYTGGTGWLAPDRYALAIDLTDGLMWVKNVTRASGWYGSSGTVTGDPVAGTLGFSLTGTGYTITAHPVVPAVTLNHLSDVATGYFASGVWLGAAPSGYIAFCS